MARFVAACARFASFCASLVVLFVPFLAPGLAVAVAGLAVAAALVAPAHVRRICGVASVCILLHLAFVASSATAFPGLVGGMRYLLVAMLGVGLGLLPRMPVVRGTLNGPRASA